MIPFPQTHTESVNAVDPVDPVDPDALTFEGGNILASMFGEPKVKLAGASSPDSVYVNLEDGAVVSVNLSALGAGVTFNFEGKAYSAAAGGELTFNFKDGATVISTVVRTSTGLWSEAFTTPGDTSNLVLEMSTNGRTFGLTYIRIVP